MASLDDDFDKEFDLDSDFDSEDDLGIVPQDQFGENAPLSPEETLAIQQEAQRKFDEHQSKTQPLDAFFKHALPSATLGATDIIGGAAGAAGHAVGSLQETGELPSKQELLDTYYEAKGFTQEERDKALEDQPAASVAGMIGGGFATPIPGAALAKGAGKAAQFGAKVLPSMKGMEKAAKMDKLAKLMKSRGKLDEYTKLKKAQLGILAKESAKEGAKVGTAIGLTQGDAKLLEGEVAKTGEQALIGGAIGASASSLFSVGSKVTSDFISDFPIIKEMKSAFSRGMEGKGLGDEEVTNEIVKTANRFNKEFESRLKKHGAAIGEAKKMADDLGLTIDTKESLDKLSSVVNEIDSPTKKKQIKRVLAEIYDYIDDGAEQLKLQDKIEKQILKKRVANQSVGETARLKQQKKALKDAIEQGDVPVETKLSKSNIEEVIPGESGPSTIATRKDTILKDGVPVEKISTEDATPFLPTKPAQMVDIESGRPIVAYKDQGTGKISSVVGDAIDKIDSKDMTVKQADRLKNLLQDFSNLKTEGSDQLTSEVKQAITKASQSIGDQIKDASSKASPMVKLDSTKYSKLKSAMKELKMVLPKNTKMSMENRERFMQDKLHKFIVSPDTTMELKQIGNVVDDLAKVDQKLALEFSDEVQRLREVYQSQQRVSSDINSVQLKSIAGSVLSLANRASNILGQGVSAPFRAASSISKAVGTTLATRTTEIVKASPAQVQGLVSKIQSGGNKAHKMYLGPLQNALKSNPRTKQAIMFGLSQQAPFRDMVNEYSETEQEPDKKE